MLCCVDKAIRYGTVPWGVTSRGRVSLHQITGRGPGVRRVLGLRITLDSSDKWYKIMQKLGHCLSLAAPIVTYYKYIPLFPLLC